MQHLPGLTTNIEFGRWEDSRRIVLGAPPGAAHVGYLRECAARVGAPSVETLDELAATAVARIRGGARHAGVERQPLLLWALPAFQAWWARCRTPGQMPGEVRLLWADGDGR
jgi:hypothetical protein